MGTMVIMPNSASSPSINGALASTPAQDDGPVNPLCEAHNNDCRTGCFVMRKIIAHVFGRNKACTSQIPDHCWVQWCRKHYQRLRHRMLEQGWIYLQINCIRKQLGKMERWGEVQSFTIILQRKFQEELNLKDPVKNPKDEAELVHLPDTTTESKVYHATKQTKASPNGFLYPFLGAEKSFDNVYAVIDTVEKAANEGQIKVLPPLQFLPLIDAPLRPPPRPRKQRKRKVHKQQAHNSRPNNDSDLETLVDSNVAESIDSSPSWHSLSALKSSLSHNTIKDQVTAELASPPVTGIPEHEIKYAIISDDDDAAAERIVPDSTDSEAASNIPSPAAQPSNRLNNTIHQVEERTPTTENEVDEAVENEMQDSTVDKDKVSAALIAESIAKKKQSNVASNALQLAHTSASQNGDSMTKECAGVTGLLSSRVEKTDYSRKILIPAPFPPKIQAQPPGSIPVIDKEHGVIGYKTVKAKSDKVGPLSAQSPNFHPRISRKKAATFEPASTLRRNNPIQLNPYPKDPTRTYQLMLDDVKDLIEAPAADECKDFAMETHIRRSFLLERHAATNAHKDTDTPVIYDGNSIASFSYGWAPVNASTVKTSYAISVGNMVNTNDNKEAMALDSHTSTNSANSEKFSLAPSPSSDGNADTDPLSFGISASSIARYALEQSSRILPIPGNEKRRRDDAEQGPLLKRQSLGKRKVG